MPTGPQYSEDIHAHRYRVSVNVDLETMRLAKGAWKWAYLNHIVDEASFVDWVNVALDASTGAVDDAGPTGRTPRMYWIDRDKLDKLAAGPGSRSQVFRAAIAEATAQLLAAAEERGVTIEPIDRLPSKIWRE